jgi:membrane-associated protein
MRRLLHSRDGLLIVFAVGVLLWATEAALLGYVGGSLFEDRPFLGLLLGLGGALVITAVAYAVGRSTEEVSS